MNLKTAHSEGFKIWQALLGCRPKREQQWESVPTYNLPFKYKYIH